MNAFVSPFGHAIELTEANRRLISDVAGALESQHGRAIMVAIRMILASKIDKYPSLETWEATKENTGAVNTLKSLLDLPNKCQLIINTVDK